jgi:hypothetical protein
MRIWMLAATLVLSLLPAPALAEPSEFRVAGSFSNGPTGRNGELVPVVVPWDGVNSRGEIVSCLTGPFNLKDDVMTIQRSDSMVKLKLQPNAEEAGWELLEATGACNGLRGSGQYRITSTPMVRLIGSLDFATPTPPAS